MKIRKTCQDVQGKPVYLWPECKPRHTVGKVLSAIASSFIGAAIATMPQVSTSDDAIPLAHVPYEEPYEATDTENQSSNLASTLKEQKERLHKIVGLSHTDPSKVQYELNKLREFYIKNYLSSEWSKIQQEREKLADEAKADFKIIFLDSLKSLLTNDIEKHEIAISNIKTLRYAFPLSSLHDPFRTNIDKDLEIFFSVRFQHIIEDFKVASSLTDKARELLSMVDKTNPCIETFFQWVEKESKFASSKNDSSDEFKMLRNSLLDTFYSIPYDFGQRLKLLTTLFKNYTYLMSVSKSDPKALSKVADLIRHTISFVSHHSSSKQYPAEIKEIIDLLIPLYDSVVEEICNLPESKERTNLLEKVFACPISSASPFISTQDEEALVVKPLTKHYFSKEKNRENLEEFDLFMDQITSGVNPYTGSCAYKINFLFSLVDKNPDYFLSCFQKSIENFKETCEKRKANSDGTISNEIGWMAENFIGLVSLAKLKTANHIDKELKERVSKWVRDNFGEPLFQVFIDMWNNEKVSVKDVKSPVRNERFVDSASWEEFNDILGYMIQDNPYFASKLIDVVKERLKVDRDPNNRKMAIETLSAVMPLAIKDSNEVSAFDFMEQLIVYEDNLPSMMALGKLLADRMHYEYKIQQASSGIQHYVGPDGRGITKQLQPTTVPYETFFNKLDKYSNGDITFSELKLRKKGDLSFTKTQELIFDLISISEGDVKQFEKLTGRKLNPPIFWGTYENTNTREKIEIEIGSEKQKALDKNWILVSNKIDRSKQDVESFKLFFQMMRNARAALAYSGSMFTGEYKKQASAPWQKQIVVGEDLGKDYKKALLTMLGKKIGFCTRIQNLGYEVGSYIELCIVTKFLVDKETSVKNAHLSEEDRIIETQKEKKAIDDLINEQFQSLKQTLFDNEDARFKCSKNQRLIRLTFAKQVIDSAPSGGRMIYMDFLVEHLGFSPTELINIDKEIGIANEFFKGE